MNLFTLSIICYKNANWRYVISRSWRKITSFPKRHGFPLDMIWSLLFVNKHNASIHPPILISFNFRLDSAVFKVLLSLFHSTQLWYLKSFFWRYSFLCVIHSVVFTWSVKNNYLEKDAIIFRLWCINNQGYFKCLANIKLLLIIH